MRRAARRRTVGRIKHSKHVMWGCVGLLVLAAGLAVARANAAYVLFALPCIVMMGAMVWMMMRGIGGGSGGSGQGSS
jgi:hypothetical protein